MFAFDPCRASRLGEHEVANINTAPETNATNGLHRAGYEEPDRSRK